MVEVVAKTILLLNWKIIRQNYSSKEIKEMCAKIISSKSSGVFNNAPNSPNSNIALLCTKFKSNEDNNNNQWMDVFQAQGKLVTTVPLRSL